MAERFKEVVPYSVDYVCDDCGIGVMVCGDEVLTTWPAQYPHKCNKCGAVKNLKQGYPKIIYKEIGSI